MGNGKISGYCGVACKGKNDQKISGKKLFPMQKTAVVRTGLRKCIMVRITVIDQL